MKVNMNQKPAILKALYWTFLHINYQQVNTLHYRTDLLSKIKGAVLFNGQNQIYKQIFINNETNQFTKLNHDPTKSVEGNIQRLLRKFKSRLSQKEYYQLYRTGSCAGKFYGTAKVYKLPPDGNISNLPLRPIVLNIGTTSYQLAK